MDIRQLEYILTIAEEKNLSRAAERLFITQSALSQQLAKLEAQGLPPLFVRNKGEMVLTNAGKIYINGARTIMKIDRDAKEALKDIRSSKTRHIHIGVCRLFQPLYYEKILPWIKRTYADVEVTTITPAAGQVRHFIECGETDLVLFAAGTRNELLKYTALSEDELVLAHLPEYENVKLPISLPGAGTHLRLLANEALSKTKLTFSVYAEPDDVNASISLAKLGECAALIPKSFARNTGLSFSSLTPAFHYENLIATSRKASFRIISEICDYIVGMF